MPQIEEGTWHFVPSVRSRSDRQVRLRLSSQQVQLLFCLLRCELSAPLSSR